MPAAKKPDDLTWQQEYARELLRTAGKVATFQRYSGGWWTLVIDGEAAFQRRQRKDILAMTENLKKRPDHVPATPAA